ncbi:MAG: SET domain-containing protein [Actinomycetota bacterium]|nr:SET domain-containing protein [Actinomycetota bacterium]MDQ3679693.1 SET domain-containing protein [Actinomycetota bacterium]
MVAPVLVGHLRAPSACVLTRTESLFVAASPIHGDGVFAARAFGIGELVECCPVIVCPSHQEQLLEQTALRGLYFTWEDDAIAVALGFGSLYNHAWRPNARYELDHGPEVVRFFAVRAIAEGEEITVNYTGEPDGRGDLWFEASG